MPQLDVNSYLPQVVWLVITFSALLIVMWRVAVPRIAEVLEARQKRMDDNVAKAEQHKKEAEAALNAYEQVMAEARTKAHAMIAEAGEKIAAEAAEREARQAESLNRRIKEAEQGIARAVEAAIANIRDSALEVAVAAAERLTGEAPDGKAIRAAVDGAFKAKK
jgi:F-type H+-transporting ATPase subunit b